MLPKNHIRLLVITFILAFIVDILIIYYLIKLFLILN
jgi:phage shock protein PspC (stress-responsive transcriptional regulator)